MVEVVLKLGRRVVRRWVGRFGERRDWRVLFDSRWLRRDLS